MKELLNHVKTKASNYFQPTKDLRVRDVVRETGKNLADLGKLADKATLTGSLKSFVKASKLGAESRVAKNMTYLSVLKLWYLIQGHQVSKTLQKLLIHKAVVKLAEYLKTIFKKETQTS